LGYSYTGLWRGTIENDAGLVVMVLSMPTITSAQSIWCNSFRCIFFLKKRGQSTIKKLVNENFIGVCSDAPGGLGCPVLRCCSPRWQYGGKSGRAPRVCFLLPYGSDYRLRPAPRRHSLTIIKKHARPKTQLGMSATCHAKPIALLRHVPGC